MYSHVCLGILIVYIAYVVASSQVEGFRSTMIPFIDLIYLRQADKNFICLWGHNGQNTVDLGR